MTVVEDSQTCDLADDLATLEKKLGLHGQCVVVDGEGVVLGLVRSSDDAHHAPDTVVLDVMDASPRTVRPSASLNDVAELFDGGGEPSVLVTSLEGQLVGQVRSSPVGSGS
mgnify:CR=1 FL=1